jgi:hypothetical protein
MEEQEFLAELGTTIAGCSSVVRSLFCEVQAFALFDKGIVRSDLDVLSGEGQREAASYVVDTFARQLWGLVHLGAETLRAFGLMLCDTHVGWPAYSLARTTLEQCGSIGWMLGLGLELCPAPETGGMTQIVRRRMARGIYLRGSDLYEDWALSKIVDPDITPFERAEPVPLMKRHAAEVGITMDTSKRGTPTVDGVKKRSPSDSVKDIVQTVEHLPEIPYKLLSASAHARASAILRSISYDPSQSGIRPVAVREITRISGLAAAVWVETMGRVAGYLGANSDPNDPNNPLVLYGQDVHRIYAREYND